MVCCEYEEIYNHSFLAGCGTSIAWQRGCRCTPCVDNYSQSIVEIPKTLDDYWVEYIEKTYGE